MQHRSTMLGAVLAAASMSLGMPVAIQSNRFDDLDSLEDRLDTLKRISSSGRRSRKIAHPQHPTANRAIVKAARKANVRRMQGAK